MNYTNWTQEENQYIADNYKTKMDKEMASDLNRTEAAVRMHRLNLGLTKNNSATRPVRPLEPLAGDDVACYEDSKEVMNKKAAQYLLNMLMDITQGHASIYSSEITCELGEFYTLKVEFAKG